MTIETAQEPLSPSKPSPSAHVVSAQVMDGASKKYAVSLRWTFYIIMQRHTLNQCLIMCKQVYHVVVKDNGRQWSVYRRYTEFCRLHSILKKLQVFFFNL